MAFSKSLDALCETRQLRILTAETQSRRDFLWFSLRSQRLCAERFDFEKTTRQRGMAFSKSLDTLCKTRQLRILTAETQSSQRFFCGSLCVLSGFALKDLTLRKP